MAFKNKNKNTKGVREVEENEINNTFNQTSLVQLNTHHSRTATIELERRTYDIAIIQEPFVYANKLRYIDTKCKSIYVYRTGRPRAAVITKKELDAWLVEEYSNEDQCVISVNVNKKTIYIASVYLDITTAVVSNTLQRLINHCNNEKNRSNTRHGF